MFNEIITLKEKSDHASLLLSDEEIWHTNLPQKDKITFKDLVNSEKQGWMFKHGKVKYSSIAKICINELSDTITIFYSENKEKLSKLKLAFVTKEVALRFGRAIASKTELKEKIITENKVKKILISVLWSIVTIAATFFIASVDIEDHKGSGSGDAKMVRAILILIKSIFGKTGILISGAVIVIFILYFAVKRYLNPVNDFVYE
ncbi:MAG: hypothetical protein HKN51_12450 [Saprospiraceae bacterium]|nr:hypothetical protein [Saprospiraceae bacterium]